MQKKYKVGLFFGSFNPVHVGHLVIAESLLNTGEVDEVWMVVSPQNPFKEKSSLAPEGLRYEMLFLATQHHPRVKASNIEFFLPKPSYTIDTLSYLTEQYSDYEFALLMGEDNLSTLHKWKNYEAILKYHDIYVYPRMGAQPATIQSQRIKRIQAPIMELSATAFRNLYAQNKYCQFMVPQVVFEYIDKNLLYAKP